MQEFCYCFAEMGWVLAALVIRLVWTKKRFDLLPSEIRSTFKIPEDKKASSKEIVLFLFICFKSNKYKKHPQGLWGSSQDWMDTGYLGRTGQEGKEGNCPVCGIAAGTCGAVPGEGDEPARAPGAGAEHHGTNGAGCLLPTASAARSSRWNLLQKAVSHLQILAPPG